MSLKYLILTAAISPSLIYAIKGDTDNSSQKIIVTHQSSSNKESTDKKKQELKKDRLPSKADFGVARKKAIPNIPPKKNHDIVVTHISSLLVPITFHGRTKQLYHWLNDKKSRFGLTPFFKQTNTTMFLNHGPVNQPDNSHILSLLASQDVIHISNTHKHYTSEKEYVYLGSFIVGDICHSHGSKITQANILTISNAYLATCIANVKKDVIEKHIEKM
jgi:hypothetical protein